MLPAVRIRLRASSMRSLYPEDFISRSPFWCDMLAIRLGIDVCNERLGDG